MKVFVGLGNPGGEYEGTRHNVGFMVVDEINRFLGGKKWAKNKTKILEYAWHKVGDEEVELIKPLTYMNESGQAIGRIKSKHKDFQSRDLYVLHDDLDLPLGEYRIQLGKGPHHHNGLLSIYQHLKTKEFYHVRIGVDNRSGERIIPGREYVLGRFTGEEMEILKKVINNVIEDLKHSPEGGIVKKDTL